MIEEFVTALLGGALIIDALDSPEPPAVPQIPEPIPPRVASHRTAGRPVGPTPGKRP